MGRHFVIGLMLAIASSVFSLGQSASPAIRKPDPADLLSQVASRYKNAHYDHIEAIQQRESKGDLFNHWDKVTLAASVASGNRYRFEAHGEHGAALKISDGKTETYYNFQTQEYTQDPIPSLMFQERVIYYWESDLLTSFSLLKSIHANTALLSPIYLPDETITLEGKSVSCYVVQGKAKYRGGPSDLTSTVNYWIDKDKLLIRKIVSHWTGTVRAYAGYAEENRTTTFPIMELGESALPDSFFAFRPPEGAKHIVKFLDPVQPRDLLAGKTAPEITLKQTKSNHVTLQDYRGKPVLLDFWATWCAPCVAELDHLKKIQEESPQKDLVILGINEDDKGVNTDHFLAEHGITWSNFHDDGEIWRALPSNGGIPYYVLINSSGQIVFSKPSASDAEIRNAIAGLASPPANTTSEEKQSKP
jgi:peroxiredoxin/outer membrane lipoprotein-sorting protein